MFGKQGIAMLTMIPHPWKNEIDEDPASQTSKKKKQEILWKDSTTFCEGQHGLCKVLALLVLRIKDKFLICAM